MPMSPRLLRPRAGVSGTGFDADAATYILAVAVADGQALEPVVGVAINNFVVGCKADGIWSAIKASCILMGARTLSGALTPLVGAAPTNVNFVAGDYDRKTGLLGNGSTKYLNSNRANNADPQDSNHIVTYISSSGVVANRNSYGASDDFVNITAGVRNRNAVVLGSNAGVTGLLGTRRSGANNWAIIGSGVEAGQSSASSAPTNSQIFVFARNAGGPSNWSDARQAFYSIGESVNGVAFSSRVATLFNAIGAAIP